MNLHQVYFSKPTKVLKSWGYTLYNQCLNSKAIRVSPLFQQNCGISRMNLCCQLPKHFWWVQVAGPSRQHDLAGGFKYFLFSPLFGEDFQFHEHIFQMGWFNHQPVMYDKKNAHCLSPAVSLCLRGTCLFAQWRVSQQNPPWRGMGIGHRFFFPMNFRAGKLLYKVDPGPSYKWSCNHYKWYKWQKMNAKLRW